MKNSILRRPVIFIVLMTMVFVFSGCYEQRYYRVHREHSGRYMHRQEYRSHHYRPHSYHHRPF